MTEKKRACRRAMSIGGILLGLLVLGLFFTQTASVVDFTQKNLAPTLHHLFGTDWMGRDMLARTLAAMSVSLLIGCSAALISGLLSALLGTLCLIGKKADAAVSWCIDLLMGLPHILLLLLLAIACGRGLTGVVVGISLTHWPSLARVLRGEGMQLRQAPFVQIAQRLGQNPRQIAVKHLLPHLLPQFFVGLVLTFPHAILHEASITFLGFGLSPEQPSVGVLLSESMRYLAMGKWWLAVFPGACLAGAVLLFSALGENLRKCLTP